jgi:hypothetical protein
MDPPSPVSAAVIHPHPTSNLQALLASADLLRGNYNVQVYFSTFMVPETYLHTPTMSRASTPSGHKRSSSQLQISVLDALIAMALTSTAPYTYEQRLAATQCIQGFIYSNPTGQEGLLTQIISKYQQNSEAESNLLRHILDGSDKDAYRTWFACVILLHLLDSSGRCKEMMRAITIGDSSSGEEVISSLQQINANLSAALINSYDPRIAVGYLMLLSIWLYEDPLSVAEFLEEGSGIQTLVGTIAQGRDGIFVTGLSAVLLGICVEFNSAASSLPP